MIALGITCEHDSGAALVVNGRLVAAVNEERLTREKFPVGFPSQSVIEVMGLAKINPSDIDVVYCGSRVHVSNLFWGGRKALRQRLIENMSCIPVLKGFIGSNSGAGVAAEILYASQFFYRREVATDLINLGIKAPLRFIDHHYSHASSAYFSSGWDDCLVLTLDAQGDGFCSKVYLGEGGCLRLIHSIPFLHSPGYYYMYVTMLAGFKYGQDGKITGLASYGKPEETEPIFKERVVFDRGKISFRNKGYYLQKEIEVLKRRLSGIDIKDVSAGVQEHIENLVTSYISGIIKQLGSRKMRVAIAGGMFANVKVNQRIAELDEVEEVFIYPHMGDGGLAVGAAMAEASRYVKCESLHDAYLGRVYSDEEVVHAIKGRSVKYSHQPDIESAIARLLVQKAVVGRFTGRMEYGPRALGNRSILVSPAYLEASDILNKRLKRDVFMPFAPAVMAEEAHNYLLFDEKKSGRSMEFMTMACDVTERCRKEAPMAVHVDGTARPQLVREEINPSLYKVLRCFKELTGTPMVINTSFNKHEEPIVNTPNQALDMLMEGGIDALAINSYVVTI